MIVLLCLCQPPCSYSEICNTTTRQCVEKNDTSNQGNDTNNHDNNNNDDDFGNKKKVIIGVSVGVSAFVEMV